MSLETLLTQLAETSWMEWLGMTTGIVGVWLSIKEKVAAWLFFIACYVCYVYISHQFGLHAFMVMNVAFIGISIYGFWKWSRNRHGSIAQLPITRTKPRHWPLVGLFLLLGTLGVGAWLSSWEEASLPYLDAFAACCGFAAQWMLSRKHIETWIFWIISDLVYIAIFIISPSWPSVILFSVFIVLAIKGWLEWQAGFSKNACSES